MANIVGTPQLISPIIRPNYLNAANLRPRAQYLVRFDGPAADNGLKAVTATGVPQPGEMMPGTALIVNQVDPLPDDPAGINWTVTVEYALLTYQIPQSVAAGSYPPSAGAQIPPWQYNDRLQAFRTVSYEKAMTADFSATPVPVVNTAKDPPADPIMKVLRNPLLVIARSRLPANFNPFTAANCIDSINAAAYTITHLAGTIIVGAEKSVLHNIEIGEERWSATDQVYYNIVLELELEGQFLLKTRYYQNRGFRAKPTSSATEAIFCTDPGFDPDNLAGDHYLHKDGATGDILYVPVNAPVFLQIDGMRLPAGIAPTVANNYADLQFTHYPTKSWSGWI